MKTFLNIFTALAMLTSSAYAQDEDAYQLKLESMSKRGFNSGPYMGWHEKYKVGNFPEGAPLCANGSNPEIGDGTLDDLASSAKGATKSQMCGEARKKKDGNRFDQASCESAFNCTKYFRTLGGKNFGFYDEMGLFVAQDYGKNILLQNMDKMESFEAVRAFADKKFNTKLGDKCSKKIEKPNNGLGCNEVVLDKVYNTYQKYCSSSSQSSCYNTPEVGVKNLETFKKDKRGNDSVMVGYSQYRINEKVKRNLNGDDEYLALLAAKVTSDTFKNATPEVKAAEFLQLVEREKRDPILFFDFKDEGFRSQNLLEQEKFKDLLNLLESPNLTAASFTKGFNDFRQKRAEAILGDGEICGSITSVTKICEEVATLASNRRRVSKDAQVVEHTSSRESYLISQEATDYANKLKSVFGDDFDITDFEIMMNARRCVAFNLIARPTGGPKDDDDNYASKYGEGGNGGNGDNGGGSGTVVPPASSGGSSTTTVVTSSGSKKVADYEGNGDLADKLSNAISSGNQMSAVKEYKGNYTPSSADEITEGKDKESSAKKDESISGSGAVNQPGQSGQNSEKMNDLLKRLAAAEEKVDKMKAAADEAETAKAKQKKIDEENALIKELKSQISDLKNENLKKDGEKVAAAAAVVADTQRAPASVLGNSFNSKANAGRSDSSSKGSEGYDAKGGSASGGAAGAALKGGVNSAILTSSTAVAIGAGSIMVDGMTPEKMTQTISNRIIELNGKPFDIEEGGLIKAIIAVMKDGKVVLDKDGNPMFEKITKGKVGDKKLLKDKRTPANITDSADLKRDQEEKLKRERAEYIKLKNLTKDILKQK